MLAITEDHWNDIVMNVAALIFPIIAFYVPKVWWIDPAGGILISCYILWRWYEISLEQVRNIVGIIAPEEFILQVEGIVSSHNSLMAMDKVTAYHFGQRYVCEIEVVMHPDTTLQVSHDVAMDLQHKVEGLANVERAFVHVDYSKRDYLEHKVERALQLKERSTTSPTASLSAQADTNTGLRHRGTEAL
jgi:divalent metal cation (Fe/Co/Zn/Cd) transporter